MNLPDKIQIKLTNNDNLHIDNIIIEAKVKSGSKNHYFIHFPKTNIDGISTLTKSDFIGQFEDHLETGLMDYNGTIEKAISIVEISLYDPTPSLKNKSLVWPLLKNEKNKWNTREEEYNYRTSCSNLEFELNPILVDLEKTSYIELNIKKRKTIS